MTMAAVVTVTVATVIVPVVVSVRCLRVAATASDVTRFVCRV